MNNNRYKGKAIYRPTGRAKEYAQWACNFYTGCSNNCSYCYCKRGVLSSTWSAEPQLKRCFKNEEHALTIFEKEMNKHITELQEHGLFFTFTSDPFLQETIRLTLNAVLMCRDNDIPVKILTKRADFIYCESWMYFSSVYMTELRKKGIAIGFTLTGHDELELGASTNQERIGALRRLRSAGFKTWVSLEPVVDTVSSLSMLYKSNVFCDHYKIGLMSGKKYDKDELYDFVMDVILFLETTSKSTIYFKDSLLEAAGIGRDKLPDICVDMDYNVF